MATRQLPDRRLPSPLRFARQRQHHVGAHRPRQLQPRHRVTDGDDRSRAAQPRVGDRRQPHRPGPLHQHRVAQSQIAALDRGEAGEQPAAAADYLVHAQRLG